MTFKYNGEKHIFEAALRSTDIKEKMFFLNSQKYIFIHREYLDWSIAMFGEDQSLEHAREYITQGDHFDSHEYNLYLPFKKIWIEFQKKNPESDPIGYAIFSDRKHSLIVYGAGYDLTAGHSGMGIGIVGLDGYQHTVNFDLKPKEGDSIGHILKIQLAKMTQYLQTEFVDMQSQTFRHGGRVRRGKLIHHVSEYQVVYRKQPKLVTHDSQMECEVDWQHRWRVRGHWRQVKGIGYDADGNEMQGWTWVKAHVKGPEDKPLVEKTKIIRNTLPPDFVAARA